MRRREDERRRKGEARSAYIIKVVENSARRRHDATHTHTKDTHTHTRTRTHRYTHRCEERKGEALKGSGSKTK